VWDEAGANIKDTTNTVSGSSTTAYDTTLLGMPFVTTLPATAGSF
jgi:hypothetical protein